MADRERGCPVRVAAIGCGYWGKNLVRNFAELSALAAICDPDRNAANQLAELHRTRVAKFDAVLRDNEIAGVAIAAPAALHAELAARALEAGKHVFVEKPLALTIAEAEQLCVMAEREDRRLMVGHLLQYHPAFIKLRELVREAMPVPQKAEADPVLLDEGEPLNLECRHFLDCIANGSTPRTDGREGLRVLRVLARASDALKKAQAAIPAPAEKTRSYSGVQLHESVYVDEPCEIGSGTRIWHFVHILPRTRIGRNCSLGKN